MGSTPYIGFILCMAMAGSLLVPTLAASQPCDDVVIDRVLQNRNDRPDAGVHLGNGGDVLVKTVNGAMAEVILLDFYEAEELRGIHHDLGEPTLPVWEKAKGILRTPILPPMCPIWFARPNIWRSITRRHIF